MNDEEILYINYSRINPYLNKGLGDNYKKYEKKKFWYFVPKFLSKKDVDGWILDAYLSRSLKSGVSVQMYFDLVALGISSINFRPKCRYCGKEAKFKINTGYFDYCKDNSCARKNAARLCSLKLKGRPLSLINRIHISQAKKGKKLTEEQRLRRPRGYHFHHTQETKDKLSAMKKGKVRSRKYYDSGKYLSEKFNMEIEYLSSYEKSFLEFCEKCKYVRKLEIPDPIKYKYLGEIHRYYPDYLIELSSGIRILIEVKAHNMINDKKVISKRLYAKDWCRKNNAHYVTLTEKEIFIAKGSDKSINFKLDLYKFI